ncbi:hypothetical protein REPUB_Repub12eG0188300 [Reevesia pubescens]
MASSSSSTISCSNTNSRSRKHFPLERRPRMLKDFLLDDSNSCSSNGFKPCPRKACQGSSSIRSLIQIDLNSDHAKPNYGQRLQRSRSKAASTTISAFQAMINAVKNIHLITSVKSHSILPRSLSRKLSKKNSQSQQFNLETKITVRVKDIIRWKSFRDLVEEKSRPSDFASSPHHCTNTTTTGSTCTPCSSNGSSWCDSDFTSEYLPSEEYGENEIDVGKNFLPCVGKDPMETTTEEGANTAVGPKDIKCESEEKVQQSPHSVLDLEYEEDDEDLFSSFNQSPAIIEKTKQKPMQKIQCFESLAKLEPVNLEKWMSLEEIEEKEETNEVEEKARQLQNHVKETSSLKSYKNISTDKLLLDLFREELATKWIKQIRNEEIECDMVRLAKAWINGEHNGTTRSSGVWEKKEGCVRDMEREGRWSKFEEEQEELAWEVESGVMNILVDELLFDLL